VPIQNLEIRASDLCPVCGESRHVKHEDIPIPQAQKEWALREGGIA